MARGPHDEAPRGVQLECLRLAQTHYPERMGLAVVAHPPAVFWLLWAAAQPFLVREGKGGKGGKEAKEGRGEGAGGGGGGGGHGPGGRTWTASAPSSPPPPPLTHPHPPAPSRTLCSLQDPVTKAKVVFAHDPPAVMQALAPHVDAGHVYELLGGAKPEAAWCPVAHETHQVALQGRRDAELEALRAAGAEA